MKILIPFLKSWFENPPSIEQMCLEITYRLGLTQTLLCNFIIQLGDWKQRDVTRCHQVIKMSESKTSDSIFSYLYFSDTYDLNLIVFYATEYLLHCWNNSFLSHLSFSLNTPQYLSFNCNLFKVLTHPVWRRNSNQCICHEVPALFHFLGKRPLR